MLIRWAQRLKVPARDHYHRGVHELKEHRNRIIPDRIERNVPVAGAITNGELELLDAKSQPLVASSKSYGIREYISKRDRAAITGAVGRSGPRMS